MFVIQLAARYIILHFFGVILRSFFNSSNISKAEIKSFFEFKRICAQTDFTRFFFYLFAGTKIDRQE